MSESGQCFFEPMSPGALAVLSRRYLQRDRNGRPVETPEDMFRRVARTVSAVEADGPQPRRDREDAFYGMLRRLEFLPNSPTLMNAGRDLGQLSACFVLPVEDSIASIFETLKNAALIHKSGGGTGFSFSRLRPAGDIVHSTGGRASGPVSFMRVFDMATDTVKQGGARRGANMGILRVDHPDINEFITIKRNRRTLNNFNLSVGVTGDFMEKAASAQAYALINPRTGRTVGTLDAARVFRSIVDSAWRTGEPGLIFLDRLNRDNPTPGLGCFESTNPCGEQPLLPYESCNLGSLNLSRMVRANRLDWSGIARTVRLAVRFLDNVIEANRYPLPQIAAITRANRKIGLGVMGWADLLIRLRIAYDSRAALDLAERLMAFIRSQARHESARLALERGAFPNFPGSRLEAAGSPPLRNATCTTIAPTGTISLIADCSSGIEPLFALSYTRRIFDREERNDIHPLFARAIRNLKCTDPGLLQEVAARGSIQHLEKFPAELRRLFVTARDIPPAAHVRMQAAFQRHTDNAVSKTVNLPRDAAPELVAEIFELAYRKGCKGITVYREGTRPGQTLALSGRVLSGSEASGGCPVCRPCSETPGLKGEPALSGARPPAHDHE